MTSFMAGYTREAEVARDLVEILPAAIYAHPTLRLGQLLTIAARGDDLFNLHDEVLVERLKEMIEKGKEDS